jgi:hypothetical protein
MVNAPMLHYTAPEKGSYHQRTTWEEDAPRSLMDRNQLSTCSPVPNKLIAGTGLKKELLHIAMRYSALLNSTPGTIGITNAKWLWPAQLRPPSLWNLIAPQPLVDAAA